jgi:hypothetical protein
MAAMAFHKKAKHFELEVIVQSKITIKRKK